MKYSLLALAAVALLADSSVMASDVHATILAPSSPWNINYGEDSCRLTRIFGSGDERTAFYVEKFGIGTSFTLLMAGKSLKHLDRSDSVIRFSNGGGAERLTAGEFGEFGPSIIAMSGTLNPAELADDQSRKVHQASADAQYRSSGEDDPADRWLLTPDQMHRITWVEISRRKDSLRLNTGPLDKPMEALTKCVDDLVKSWGVDPAELRAIKQGPKPSSGSILSVARAVQEHYPSAALSKGAQASLSVRLILDATGRVKACKITHITEAKDFDDYPCRAFEQKGKFSPALDARGNPIKSIYRTTVVYRMN